MMAWVTEIILPVTCETITVASVKWPLINVLEDTRTDRSASRVVGEEMRGGVIA